MKIDLTEFISAGFYIICSNKQRFKIPEEFSQDSIVSASSCISYYIPDTWCIEWANEKETSRIEEAEMFEIGPQKLKEITDWTTSRFDKTIFWPNVILDLETVEELVFNFLKHVSNIKIIGYL